VAIALTNWQAKLFHCPILMRKEVMTEIADLIAAEDKLYFDRKAAQSALMKGFILGSIFGLTVATICGGAGFALFCSFLNG